MSKKSLMVILALGLSGCATSKKDQISVLEFANTTLQATQNADCETVKTMIGLLQEKVQTALDDLKK